MQNLSELLKKAQEGNKEAFGKIYKFFYKKIYRYCKINIYKSELAEDVCQETFIRAWKSLPSFSINYKGTFQAYLFRIARNLIIDLSRKKKEFSLENVGEIGVENNLEENIDKEAEINNLKKALSKLNEIDRQVIILRYFEEMSHKEVAEVIGINEGALRVKTIRLLKKIKEIIIKL